MHRRPFRRRIRWSPVEGSDDDDASGFGVGCSCCGVADGNDEGGRTGAGDGGTVHGFLLVERGALKWSAARDFLAVVVP